MSGKEDGLAKKAKAAYWFSVLSVAAVGMTVGNKALMKKMNAANAIMFAQNGLTVMFLLIGLFSGKVVMKPFTMRQVKIFFVSSLILASQLVTALYALPHVAIATVVIFRNASMAAIAFIDYFFKGATFNLDCKIAILGVMTGTFIYAGSDVNFDRVGYFWQSVNSVLYILGVLYQSHFQKLLQEGNEQTAEGNSLIEQSWTLVWAFGFAKMSGEFSEETFSMLNALSQPYLILLVCTGLGGFAISRAYANVFALATSTSVTVAANVNRAVAVAVGAVVFGTRLEAMQSFGLAWCFANGLLYSLASKKKASEGSMVLRLFGTETRENLRTDSEDGQAGTPLV
jgi:hypothetical protein